MESADTREIFYQNPTLQDNWEFSKLGQEFFLCIPWCKSPDVGMFGSTNEKHVKSVPETDHSSEPGRIVDSWREVAKYHPKTRHFVSIWGSLGQLLILDRNETSRRSRTIFIEVRSPSIRNYIPYVSSYQIHQIFKFCLWREIRISSTTG